METINWKDKQFDKKRMLELHEKGEAWYFFNPFLSGFTNNDAIQDAAIPLRKFSHDYLVNADNFTIHRIMVF